MSRHKGQHRYHLATPAIALLVLAALLPLGAAAAAPAAAAPAIAAAGRAAVKPDRVPSFGHVFVIVGENKSLYQINSTNAPYLVKTLKPRGAWFTGYNDVATGSLADYVGLTSGQFAACQTHGPCGSFNVPSIFSQLGNGNWMDWNESMPSSCYRGKAGSPADLNAYKPGHNPALYYKDLPCQAYDVPAGTTGPDDMSYFNNALAAGNVPAYNFITPNLCQAAYHQCGKGNIVTQFDNFLKAEIPGIEASPAAGPDDIIFVTFDEGHPKGTPGTMLIALGPQVQPGTYPGHYNHYSTLATIEDGLGLRCLAGACKVSTLPIFGTSRPLPPAGVHAPLRP